MNRMYRVIWSRTKNRWVVTSENTKAMKHGYTQRNRSLISLIISLLGCISLVVNAAPIGGEIVVGRGSISQSGNITTIQQQSQNISLNWREFNVETQEVVNFSQPNTQAIAVNRIQSTQGSQILGKLTAKGNVWLINPNGVIFGKSAQVNVGGLVASTLNTNDSTITGSNVVFSGAGNGSVINHGVITASTGGYVALIGNHVSNQGTIVTQNGTTALGAGNQVTVNFMDNQLVGLQVDSSTLNNLAENQQLIQADGGRVFMTAGARHSVLSSVVNNTGIIEAKTLKNHNGKIILLGGEVAGTTNVSGVLDASAVDGGNGGFIETSAGHVNIAKTAKVTTQSNNGKSGTWLIDPQDYTIAASGGDITGAQISSLLSSNNIIISSTQGVTAGSGDLLVGDAISWNNSNSLTLNAERNVSFNSGGVITNASGGTLNVRADQNATGIGQVLMNGGSINISGTGGAINFYYNPTVFGSASTFSNVTAGTGTTFTAYMLVNSLVNLSNLGVNTAGNYALGANIDASSNANFTPISSYSGNFDGLNYSISGLTENTTNSGIGLFSALTGNVKNLSLTNVNIKGNNYVGALAGQLTSGVVSNVTVSGSVSGSGSRIGGVIGLMNSGTLRYVTNNAAVSGIGINDVSDYIGGVVGLISAGTINNTSGAGNVSAAAHNRYIGGLAGYNAGTITNSQSTGNLLTALSGEVGGFVGFNNGTISTSYATGSVTAGDYGYDQNGGFAARNHGTLSSVYSTGTVTLSQAWRGGGLVGYNIGTISDSYSSSNVFATPGPVTNGNGSATNALYYGGLIGVNSGGSITNSYATGNVTGTGSAVYQAQFLGGLAGYVEGGSISHSYATGNVSAPNGAYALGGLIGYTNQTITNVYATGNVTAAKGTNGSNPAYIAGLIGVFGGTLTNGYAIGAVSASSGSTNVGGLTGGGGAISGISFWDTTTSGQATSGTTNAVGMNTANMQLQANYTSATAANGNVNPNWNFSTIWAMGTGSYLYPVFAVPNAPTSTPGVITPVTSSLYYPLNVKNITAANKVYDGTVTATTTGTLTGLLPVDTGTASLAPFVSTFANRNVGTGKTVTFSAPALSGSTANNYLFVTLPSYITTASITPRAITVLAAGQNKVYDGTTTDSVVLSSGGVLVGDTVSFSNSSADFTDKNVGTGKTVSVSGIALSGTDAGNYSANTSASTTANITPLAITVLAAGQNKVYDGTTTDSVVLSSGGVLAGDTVSFSNTSADFADKNVGTGKTVSVSGIALSGTDAGNYSANTSATTTANITPLAITVLAAGQNKVYDGTTTDSVVLSSGGVLVGDTVSFSNSSADFADKNVGIGKSVAVSGITLSGTDAGNYSANTSASTTANITPLAITVLAAGQNKVYDGTTADSVVLSSSGVLTGDTVSFSNSSADFADKNVGIGKSVAVSGIALSGTDAGNYSANTSATTTANITPLAITVLAAGQNKVYDGTTADSVVLSSGGVLAGDTVSFSNSSADFADKNVGIGKSVSVSGIALSGADAGNYSANISASTTANITPLAITVLAAGQNKVYDGTTTDGVVLSSGGVLAGDAVSFSNSSANFDDKNVGTGKTVSVSGIALSGADAGNYSANTSATTTANITPLAITVLAAGQNKVYDGTTTDSVVLSSGGVLAGDTVSFSNSSADFADKNVGIGKSVEVSGIALSGTDAGNYSANTSASATANITPLAITVLAAGQNKVYDGTTADGVVLSSGGVLVGDTVSFSNSSANFADKNVGIGKTVSVSGIALSGTDAGNYSANTSASTTANITPLVITVLAAGQNKVYDGTTTDSVVLSSGGVLVGDTVSFSNTSANFDSPDVGNNKTVTVTGISSFGVDAGNYTILNTTVMTVADILAVANPPVIRYSAIMLESNASSMRNEADWIYDEDNSQRKFYRDNLDLRVIRGGANVPEDNLFSVNNQTITP